VREFGERFYHSFCNAAVYNWNILVSYFMEYHILMSKEISINIDDQWCEGKFVEVVGPIEIEFVLQIPSVKIISNIC